MRKIMTLAVAIILVLSQACNTKTEANQENTQSDFSDKVIFPLGERGPATNFTGKAYNYGLVANDSIYNTLVGNVYFEKRCKIKLALTSKWTNSNSPRWRGISSIGGSTKTNDEKR
jgi:hypothetical protein